MRQSEVGEEVDAGCYSAVRQQSVALCEPLAVDDYGVQPILDASPPKWHLAHTTWFFETFLLKPLVPGYNVFNSAFEVLFNSYYEGVGERFPRSLRGTLSRPTVEEVLDYRAHVDDAMTRLLKSSDPSALSRVVLGLHHEQQHQELLVTDLKANLGSNPLRPAYRPTQAPATNGQVAGCSLAFVAIEGGVKEIGACPDGGFCFDNESPKHKVYVDDFALASRLTTNAEYAEFISDGGYNEATLWLSDGWAWRCAHEVDAPMYWRQDEGWREYRLAGERPAVDQAPVTHVSFFEADAFARWAGARLATEAEWETASASLAVQGNFADGNLHPQAVPRPSVGSGLAQMFGDCWEWTSSAYGPYPGFRPLAGTLGEYNGKFMSSQMVLRGGSCATPVGHVRRSYRNFFYPKDRWQFTGIRLAKDAA